MSENYSSQDALSNRLAELAYSYYKEHYADIEKTKSRIYLSKRGIIPVSEISKNKKQLEKRSAKIGVDENKAKQIIDYQNVYQDLGILKKIIGYSDVIGRIAIKKGEKYIYGTGIIIGPRLILTNHHLLPDVETCSATKFQLNFEQESTGEKLTPVNISLRPDYFFLTSTFEKIPGNPFSGLNFTIVGIEEKTEKGEEIDLNNYLPLDGQKGKIIEGESCAVIHHPDEDYKKIIFKDLRLLKFTEQFFLYESDGYKVGSGAPVISISTGKLIGLQITPVGYKDSAGRWVNRDGTKAFTISGENQAEWIANLGVRTSQIMEAIRNIVVPAEMKEVKAFFKDEEEKDSFHILNLNNVATNESKTEDRQTTNLVGFEVLLVDQTNYQEDWDHKVNRIIAGVITNVEIFSDSIDPYLKRFRYITINTDKTPFDLAAEIEALPHVKTCTPDLPAYTDYINELTEENQTQQKGNPLDLLTEEEFFQKNKDAKWIKSFEEHEKIFLRDWPKRAIHYDIDNFINETIKRRLSELWIIQLDTGYTNHKEITDGLDLEKDRDFIDNDDDAKEDTGKPETGTWYGHGTRMAGIIVARSSEVTVQGLLHVKGDCLVKIIPYKILKSISEIEKGYQIVKGALAAIRAGAEILFISTGTYPKSIFDAVVREAYYKGIIWVCPAGNKINLVPAFGVYPGTITVGAIDCNDKIASNITSFSKIDVLAPGAGIPLMFEIDGKETLRYSSATCNAVPYVVCAAALWKTKHLKDLYNKYPHPWQIIEAFRYCLKVSSRKTDDFSNGPGILDVNAILEADLPEADLLTDAYKHQTYPKNLDLGVREALHVIWNVATSSVAVNKPSSLTARGALAFDVYFGADDSENRYDVAKENLLNDYLDIY